MTVTVVSVTSMLYRPVEQLYGDCCIGGSRYGRGTQAMVRRRLVCGIQYGMLCMYESGAHVAAATSNGCGCIVGDQYGMLCMYESGAYVE